MTSRPLDAPGQPSRAANIFNRLFPDSPPGVLGDFTTTRRVIPISAMAIVLGIISTYIAWLLMRLIGLFTNVMFYGRFETGLVSPADNELGLWVIAIPVIGGLVIGLMARYGSERIRGHGIPEALEAILINGSRVQPRVAFLKPLSAAVSIGSGGPFGAEGPIIMTGGAVGSTIAQTFHLTAVERKTLLVAGAAAGMSATFATPVAGVMLAVELLLFEWKPRSLVPVALASATAAATRRYVIGMGPLFPVTPHPASIGPEGLLGCVVAGLLAGVLSLLATGAIYAWEDAFHKLPIHWMWWPAIGGLAVGVGGYIFPQALGVGYDTIDKLLTGDVAMATIFGILIVKSAIWSISLGSGTSGGVLAPLLMMGGALGGLEAGFLPSEGAGFWPLVSMAAILGGTMRCPFTGVIFALELTHDVNVLLPLLIAAILAHTFTVLVLRRSILTEKLSRRGFHLSREYSVDPLEALSVGDVMRPNPVCLAGAELAALPAVANNGASRQRLFPVMDESGRLAGVVTRADIERVAGEPSAARFVDVARASPVVAYTDEPLRIVAYRMAETSKTLLPVLDRGGDVVGMVELVDLLQGRARSLREERVRERVIPLRLSPFTRTVATAPRGGDSG